MYFIHLRGCANKSKCNSYTKKAVSNAPYVDQRSLLLQTIREDLRVPFVNDVIETRSTQQDEKLEKHIDTLLLRLLEQPNPSRLSGRPDSRLRSLIVGTGLITTQ